MSANSPDSIPRIRVPPKSAPDTPPAPRPPPTQDNVAGTVRISDSPADTSKPEIIHDHSIIRKIGDGGMGVVYLARDHKLDRYVAIKRLKPRVLSHSAFRKRFFREAKAIAALSHTNIVHVYALTEDDDGPCIVMEYVPGPKNDANEDPAPPYTIGDMVQQGGPLPLRKALELVTKVCYAVDYAHRTNVIHRDLKPSNVLINENGEPKIVDFGLARKLTGGEDPVTLPGEKMLSLGYGAPEQESGDPAIDRRADIYALGGLLYFALTGQNPRFFRPSHVPDSIRAALVKAIETDRNRRWTSAREFAEALNLLHPATPGELPTAKATWRCKWCDTLNPISVKYCGECGWDGGEICGECGAETRSGIMFCGNCGANARDYEMARNLLARLRHFLEIKRYDLILQNVGQISAFQPSGPTGEGTLREVQGLRAAAEKSIARLRELLEKIPNELKLQNFEFARQLIIEYNTLTDDKTFSAEFEKLPDLTIDHDLENLRRAVKEHDWDYARRVARAILSGPGHGNRQARRLLLAARLLPWWIAFRNVLFVVAGLFIVYVLSAAPVYRLRGRVRSTRYQSFYALVSLLHDETFLHNPLELYARAWGAPALYARPKAPDRLIEPLIPSSFTADKTDRLPSMQANFRKAILKIQSDYAKTERQWPPEYLQALRTLHQQFQRDGNFDGWELTRTEMDRFEYRMELPPEGEPGLPRELEHLQQKYRAQSTKNSLDRHQKILHLYRKYVQELEGLQKQLTKQNKMQQAGDANTEIRNAKTLPDVVAAEAAVAAHEAAQALRSGQPRR